MKNRKLFFTMALIGSSFMSLYGAADKVKNEPDSVYVFSYATSKDEGRSGLKFAWSANKHKWFEVAQNFAYVKCDYGRWGSQKRMIAPRLLFNKKEKKWVCMWDLNGSKAEYGFASSPDLIKWGRQSYFTSAEYKKYLPEDVAQSNEATVKIDGLEENGWIQKVPYSVIEELTRFAEHKKYREIQNNERTEQDPTRFAGLKPVNAVININAEDSKKISNHLIGIFFEDINYAADGGLYGELIQNRDFEYSATDGARDKNWNSSYAWKLVGKNDNINIASDAPLHPNNPHYVVIDVNPDESVTLMNSGFDGIPVRKGDKYDFSLFSRMIEGNGGKIKVSLQTKDGKELASSVVRVNSAQWKKQNTVLVATNDASDAVLTITPLTQKSKQSIAMDMISLFPQKTFMNRKNGLRNDLAQTLADLKPRFVRFPGGCVAHGDGVDNIYDWKGSIGPLEARKPLRNLWGYHQTRGLGYHEYFLFCEDMGAEPVPVVAAGVPCQNSGTCSHHSKGELECGGQQGGIPMNEMPQYVQDVLDLIEYANGDATKSEWGRKRAQAGHPKPFNLKYIGIGNEDLITDVFEERFKMIYDAVVKKHPEITVIGTVGPFYEGTDYEEGWKLAAKENIPMVDEHYYNTPGWFINNQDFYDKYDRNKSKVYLGEYAAHLPGRPNNIETALAEALYLTAVERNGDVVTMTSYAPLLAKDNHTQWTPDLIYFNNNEIRPTVGYYAQQMYGCNSGNEYIGSEIKIDNNRDDVRKRIAISVVKDSNSGDYIIKLVNILPVDVDSEINLPFIDSNATQAKRTILVGNPKDKNAKPITDQIEVSSKFRYNLPSYSFTVIRITNRK